MTVMVAASLAAFGLSACSGGGRSSGARPRSASPARYASATTVSPPTTGPSTTVAPSTTTTTVDPGTLPQTRALPSATDPQFLARMSDLLQAVASGDVSLAANAFFPLSAYIQVKGISDPVHDYDTRLIPDYDQDIQSLHAHVNPGTAPVTLDHVYVPDAAEWILPGVEYNKGSYWRVYGTRLYFRVGGQLHYFTIVSMISWRGEWYVVHLSSIR